MELDNIFTKGSQGIVVDEKTYLVPVNEDWVMIGEITAYNATIGKVSLKKVWTLATVPEIFYAQAKYPGLDGIPTSDEVVVGQYVPFYRVGIGNVNFASAPTGFQKNDESATTKASYVAFFLKQEEEE